MTRTITKEQYDKLSNNDKQLYYHDIININDATSYILRVVDIVNGYHGND